MSRKLTLKKEYYTPDGRKIKGFFRIGGKTVPIVEETGPSIPSKDDITKEASSLKGKELNDAITRADSLGSYYREDKRQKRSYIEQIASNWREHPETMFDVDMNKDILYIVRNISPYGKEMATIINYWMKQKGFRY